LEKNVSLKRQAQLLVKDGRLDDGLKEWLSLLSTGDPDPYDFVTVGDLLLRLGRLEAAYDHYEKASSAYESLGFTRNAIGVAKKILRLGGDTAPVHIRLSRLYLAEGLIAEAAQQAEAFIAATGDGGPAELVPALDLLESLRSHGVERPGLVLSLAGIYESQDRKEEAAEVLLEAARISDEAGDPAEASRLEKKAKHLAPGVKRKAKGAGPSAFEAAAEAGSKNRNAGSSPESEAGPPRLKTGSLNEDARRIWSAAKPADRTAELERQAEDAMASDSWLEAVSLLETLLAQVGDRIDVIEKLVEGYRRLGDHALATSALERLAARYEEDGQPERSRACWGQILALDPGHVQALERVVPAERTGSVDGTPPEVDYQILSGRSSVPPPGTPLIDVAELLKDFQVEMGRQIPEEDGESHYALALSHYEMGLYNEALEEIERALASSALTADLEFSCKELRERCTGGEGSAQAGTEEVA
jgi:tetratricopeptide (TPR) repeat protein